MECGSSDTSDDACVVKKLETNDSAELKNTSTEKLMPSTYDSDRENEEPNENEMYVDTRIASGETGKLEGVSSYVASDSFRDFQTPKIVRSSVNRTSSVHKINIPVISNFHGTLTSTPAPVCLLNDIRTPSPFCGSTDDMSPITMSTQKMPKSMQVRRSSFHWSTFSILPIDLTIDLTIDSKIFKLTPVVKTKILAHQK